MSNIYPLLPKLTANRQFISDFVAAKAPCFALGMVEERKQKLGLMALRPSGAIPPETMALGFNFGHSLLGDGHFEVVHFAFGFYGFGTYNVLLNPNNPLARAVLGSMVDGGEYFFLAVSPDRHVTAFRSEIGQDNLVYLKDNLARIRNSATTDMQYQQALGQFQKRPSPPGQLLTWVCRDNIGYLDLTADRLEMMPAASAPKTVPPKADAGLVGQRHRLAEHLDSKVGGLVRAGMGDGLMLLAGMALEMPLFKRLMDLSGAGGMDDLWGAYPNLYHFTELLGRIADGIRSGDIKGP